jgi:hypothetical protein
MKQGLYLVFVMAALMVLGGGCRSRCFECVGKDARGHEYAVPADSIDGYAKAHGCSRAEAAKRMRAEFVPPSDSHVENVSATTTATKQEIVNQ